MDGKSDYEVLAKGRKVDRFEELVWPAFVKYCSENEYIFNLDNVTKNVVLVTDGTVLLQKGIRGGREVWVTVDKEFVHVVFQGIMGHRRRITLNELEILFPSVRDLEFVFQVFSKMENLFRYDFKEGRVYLK